MKTVLLALVAAFGNASKHGHHGKHGGKHGCEFGDLMDACKTTMESHCEGIEEHHGHHKRHHDKNKFQTLGCLVKEPTTSESCHTAIDRHYPLAVCVPEIAELCPTIGEMSDHHGKHKGGRHGDHDDHDDHDDHGKGKGKGKGPPPNIQKEIRCIHNNMKSLSDNCTSAIETQWKYHRASMGLEADAAEPMASDVYDMVAPPSLHPQPEHPRDGHKGLILKIVLPIVAALLVGICVACFIRRRRKRRQEAQVALDAAPANYPGNNVQLAVSPEGVEGLRPSSPTATEYTHTAHTSSVYPTHTATINYQPLAA